MISGSTPSQPRTYDWDPAQAFARHSGTPPTGILSRDGSELCLADKTSSCDEGSSYFCFLDSYLLEFKYHSIGIYICL